MSGGQGGANDAADHGTHDRTGGGPAPGTGGGNGPGGPGGSGRPGAPGARVVDGRFALEARLGGGGMGTVWRARDLLLDRAVALKEVRPPDPALAEYDPDAARALRARVLREARALARVDHPNVVTIHHIVDGGGEDTYPWLVMELVTGGSLADRLARGPMDPAEAARLGREVLAALGAAHAAGIQHRDVKPANVLLRPDGRPVLTDFGIAAIRESTVLTATGSIIGTPDYMAPERITGERGGPASDLWSLAMMLYVAVEGRHPLRRGTTLATLAAVLNESVPPPERAGPLTGVLTAVLVKEPDDRPDRAALDRMLAEAAEAGAGGPAAGTVPAAPAGYTGTDATAGTGAGQYGTGDATSYPLAPPTPAPGAGPETPGRAAAPGTAPEPIAAGVTTGTVPVSGRGAADGGAARVLPRPSWLRTRLAIGAVLLSAAVTATVVWSVLPEDGDGDGAAGRPAAKSSGTVSPGSSAPGEATGQTGGSSSDRDSGEKTSSYLTPARIRAAVAALRDETGHDRVFGMTVYPQYVFFRVAVGGSETRYDSFTYDERGLKKGALRGSENSGNRPVELSRFDWDAVPGLFRTAEKELRVKDVTGRYLLVKPANKVFDTPPGLGVYLMNDYQETGYLLTDARGKVLRKYPAGS
ncbi:serine/threonine-protein kinase [Streptomyces sp. NPDC006798]|uniref:serine/threonine-protein kinase n=1 Tax=Streptomyces sp. NPDC006798 TaxID=3155462 RepID=UPI0033C69E33